MRNLRVVYEKLYSVFLFQFFIMAITVILTQVFPMAKKDQQTKYKFSRNALIGEAGAEDDENFLYKCFVSTEEYRILQDIKNNQSVILGRTGAGKTALLLKLEENEEHVIRIEPDELALDYISNSDVIQFFENAGTRLDPFYKLLWEHIFVIELLQHKFGKNDSKDLLSTLLTFTKKDKRKEAAISYLREWGDKFWEEAQIRVKEITTKIEDQLKGGVKIDAPHVGVNYAQASNLSEDVKLEYAHQAQKIVNQSQIQRLKTVLKLLSEEIFTDQKKKYYIIIDGLDEDWVENKIKFKLIKALITALREINKIPTIKVVISLRTDLFYSVIDHTKDPGFQMEKYESVLLRLSWTRSMLKDLLEKRVNYLIRSKYTRQHVNFDEILPNAINKEPPIKYLIDRTLFRPRDAILFLNEIIRSADGKATFTAINVKQGEHDYSHKRLLSVFDEWRNQYPNLNIYVTVLENYSPFKYENITKDKVEEMWKELPNDSLESEPLVNSHTNDYHSVKAHIVKSLYRVGVLGIKISGTEKTLWSHINETPVTHGQLKNNTKLYIHKTFHRALGVSEQEGIE
uniref:DNA repair ATPase n=1 Tax=Magnetococcus massalia (strain MO-1) TaxID=451514 RepID=A0A1S7LEL3_MAGMO|nr:Protein of unknown function. Putative ATPase involved in DNA repair (modular protein) [Candidatus Magnetococcus massalia]